MRTLALWLWLWLALVTLPAVAADACGCPEPAPASAATPAAVPVAADQPLETVSTHVPLPVKTITVRDLKGVCDVADELDAAQRQESQNPVE